VAVVSIDPYEVYRSRLHPHLDHAVVVADPFHIVRLANRSLGKVRRRNQQEQTGHRGRRGDPLYDVRKILVAGAERRDEKAWAKMDRALSSSDPRDEVVAAWLAKEHLREVYAVSDPEDATKLLDTVIAECKTSGIDELRRPGPLGEVSDALRRVFGAYQPAR
jgi:transposase